MKKISFDPELLKAGVYGANDGIVTTFAVIAGTMGAGLSTKIILILGIANMVADGVSMGIGDYLGERSEQRWRKVRKENYKRDGLWRTGLVTFIAFVFAGILPLLPFVVQFLLGVSLSVDGQFIMSIIATGCALFLVGSLRPVITGLGGGMRWLWGGLEMLGIGTIAAVIAYGLGFGVEQLVR